MKLHLIGLAIAGVLLAACSKPAPAPAGQANQAGAAPAAAAPEEPVLNVYNWSDYIAEDTLANFTKETGIKVTYDVFDSNETLEGKLVAGNTGYDVVVPSLNFLARQVKAGVFMPLDKSKLPNWNNLDPANLALIAVNDPGNTYAAPYLWGTTGIGYNVKKIQEIFGKDFKVDSWDVVFKPENLAKLKKCGVSFLDSPSEIIPPILNYLGEDPHSEDPAVIKKAEDLLLKLRPSITNFHSSNYIDYLANGDICIAVGWSGDIFIAKTRAEEAKKGVELAYSIPKEGAPMWFDMVAIPKDAKHPDNAHKFINYLMRPEVMAGISNFVTYANSNKASYPLVDQAVRDNPGVYPSDETRKKLFPLAVLSPEVDRLYTRIWTTVKTGQ
jgi:putrescine transport system substrate-binding protein